MCKLDANRQLLFLLSADRRLFIAPDKLRVVSRWAPPEICIQTDIDPNSNGKTDEIERVLDRKIRRGRVCFLEKYTILGNVFREDLRESMKKWVTFINVFVYWGYHGIWFCLGDLSYCTNHFKLPLGYCKL